ncbi:helix-turn-helix domain-containing protein [Haliea sp.]|uniref:helix-turn-helix domain-containing protein n=1 Tax=Haliea sp. TaxID=1932666 RepID=UPI0032EE4C64
MRASSNPPQTSSSAVLTISMEVGFRAVSTFNAAFKRETGVSPAEYRNTHLDAGR